MFFPSHFILQLPIVTANWGYLWGLVQNFTIRIFCIINMSLTSMLSLQIFDDIKIKMNTREYKHKKVKIKPTFSSFWNARIGVHFSMVVFHR